MKYLIISFLFFISIRVVDAQHFLVSSASEINGKTWAAGDTIIMQNGNWIDQSIMLRGIGTELHPVVLISQTPGLVILSSNSSLSFSGKYIEVSGLYFKDGTLSGKEVVSFRNSSSETAENCTLKNTAIVNYNPSDQTVDSKWVSLYGRNNHIINCSFENKTNMGTLLVVWLENNIIPSHTIENNYFGYRNSNLDNSGNELNGQEIIRIGTSTVSMQTANVKVIGNFFEHCNGEIEIISNKSCGNYFSNNLFLECKGMLTLRHGNGCIVEGNYFFGNGISSTGGVRVIGENHKVFNNYFEKLRGTNFRSAICLVRGKQNSLLNEYFQVKNAQILFNTMVDCSQSFSVNYNSDNTYTMPPIGTSIANNHVYNIASTNLNVNIDQTSISTLNVTWTNNLMNMGKYTNFSYSPSQVVTGKDPKMVLAGTPLNMFEPNVGSELLNYTSSDYPDISKDIRGRGRGNSKLPGASQLSGLISIQMPKKCNVGVSFSINNLLQQVISFPILPAKIVGDDDFSPNANASSGLTVSYSSSNLTVATVVNGKIHIIGPGTTIITASQVGNTTYNPAQDVTQVIAVSSATAIHIFEDDDELLKIYPNPILDNINVSFSLSRISYVNVEIYDLIGIQVKVLLGNVFYPVGNFSYSYNISKLKNGLYFVKLTTGNCSKTVKIIKISS